MLECRSGNNLFLKNKKSPRTARDINSILHFSSPQLQTTSNQTHARKKMPFWKSAPKPEPNSEGPVPITRSQQERQADEDLAALLGEFSTPPSSSTSSPASPSIPTKAEDEALKESLNCLRAFDELFYCYSLGGQFLNVYRYGKYRDCGEKTDDWLFCLRAKVRGGGNNPSTRVSSL